MGRKMAGIIVGVVIVALVIGINIISNKVGNGDTQQQVTNQVPQEQVDDGKQEELQGILTGGNTEEKQVTANTTELTTEEIQKYIQEQIAQGLAGQTPEQNTEQTIVNSEKPFQIEQPKPDEKQQPQVDPVKPTQAGTQQEGTITKIVTGDMNTILQTKTEDVVVTEKVVRKIKIDGVYSTVYEIKTTGSSHPVVILVNNTAYDSVTVGNTLKVTYNLYKGIDGVEFTNLVKLGA